MAFIRNATNFNPGYDFMKDKSLGLKQIIPIVFDNRAGREFGMWECENLFHRKDAERQGLTLLFSASKNPKN